MCGFNQRHFIHMFAAEATFHCPCITILRPTFNRVIVKFTWFKNGNEEGYPHLQIRWDSTQEEIGLEWADPIGDTRKSVVEFCEEMIGFGFKEFEGVMKVVKEWEH